MLLSPWSCSALRRIKTRECDSRTENPPIQFHVQIKSKDGSSSYWRSPKRPPLITTVIMFLTQCCGLSKDLRLFTKHTSPESDSNYFHRFVIVSLLYHWEYDFILYDIQVCSVTEQCYEFWVSVWSSLSASSRIAHLLPEEQVYLNQQSGTIRLDCFTHCLIVKCAPDITVSPVNQYYGCTQSLYLTLYVVFHLFKW